MAEKKDEQKQDQKAAEKMSKEQLKDAIVAEACEITKGKHHVQDLMALCKQYMPPAEPKKA